MLNFEVLCLLYWTISFSTMTQKEEFTEFPCKSSYAGGCQKNIVTQWEDTSQQTRLYPLFTQYLCRDNFKLSVPISWSSPRQHNTISYHPMCNGMVESFNRMLKNLLKKHAARFGQELDRYLDRVLWAYHNAPHESPGEKPSFLLIMYSH